MIHEDIFGRMARAIGIDPLTLLEPWPPRSIAYPKDSEMDKCPECGSPVAQETIDVGVGLIPIGESYCIRCDWEEGGPIDFGFVAMEARPFCPEAIEP